MRFVSPYRASRILLVLSYVFEVTAIQYNKIFGSLTKFPRRKTGLLVVESEPSSSMKDRNRFQNRDQINTLPAKGSRLFTGTFTECATGNIGSVVVR